MKRSRSTLARVSWPNLWVALFPSYKVYSSRVRWPNFWITFFPSEFSDWLTWYIVHIDSCFFSDFSNEGSSYANGLDVLSEGIPPGGLNIDDVVEKYKEAITYYSKVSHLGYLRWDLCRWSYSKLCFSWGGVGLCVELVAVNTGNDSSDILLTILWNQQSLASAERD